MTLRDAIVDNALWGVANEPQIHYRQSRPIDGLGQPRKLPLYTDCSGFVTDCYKWAGAPDPNGLGYNGTGFTGTLLDHLEQIHADELQPGDLIVFGPGNGEHVVIAVEAGPNPMCVSHGQERGPISIRLAIEAAAHHPPMTFLRGEGLDTPPPEDDMTPELKDYLDGIENRLALRITDVRNQLGESDPNDGPTQTGLAGALHKARKAIKKTFAAAGGTGDPEA